MEKIRPFLMIFLALSGCSSEQCSNVPQRPQTQAVDSAPSAQPTPAPSPAPVVVIPKNAIQVFKPTGEKQCSQDKGIPIDSILATLAQKKIQVYESHTQADGFMHMAMCGADSGTIHVFTIGKKDLRRAETLGFKVLKTQ